MVMMILIKFFIDDVGACKRSFGCERKGIKYLYTVVPVATPQFVKKKA